jgi:prepilin peptidase CpaA
MLVEVALIVLLFCASAFDLAQRRIPNRLLLVGLIVAVPLHMLSGSLLTMLATMFAGATVGLILFLPMYVLGAMAAGDVKLMATVGAFTGPLLVFQIALATYCIGGVLALAIVLALRRASVAFANVGAVMRPLMMRLRGVPLVTEPMPHPSVGGMPYAVAITLGTLLVLWLQHR